MPLLLADWLETMDHVNQVVAHPDFDSTIHNPWFLLASLIFGAVALLRGWKVLLSIYLGGIAVWYVVANVVMRDKSGADGGQPIVIFVAMVAVVAGVVIYMVLIKD